MSSTKMNELPVEILAIIFRNFDFNSKFNLRLVCKKWNSIISNLKEGSLVISNDSYVNHHWFYTNHLIDNKDRIFISDSLDHTLSLSIFSNLKKLFISFVDFTKKFKFDRIINNFNQLQELNLHEINVDSKNIIDLPRLKILYLKPVNNMIDIKLITPNLCSLATVFRDNHHEIVHCESIIYLQADEYDSVIETLLSLEILILKKFNGFLIKNLDQMINLKEIHDTGFSVLGFRNISLINRINERRQELKRPLNIFICGLKYELFHNLINLSPSPHLSPFYNKNYDNLIDRITWQKRLFISNTLTNLINASDPRKKFPNINHLFCDTIDETILFRFIKHYPRLNRLNLACSFKNHENYNLISLYCPYITRLEIFDADRILDLKFVQNFIYLSHFSTDNDVDSQFIRSSFERLKYLNDFHFTLNSNSGKELIFATIKKLSNNHLRLFYRDFNGEPRASFDEILSDLNDLKEKTII